MTEGKELVPQDEVKLGALAMRPEAVVSNATKLADALADVVKERKLYSNISGKNYVRVEGWNTLGAMLGVLPREREVKEIENGYEAYVELVRTSDGAIIGGASAICTRDERNWANRDDYAVRSMAVTRATGKAFRLGFSWIMKLAGYEATPAEEMDFIEGQFEESEPEQKPNPQSGFPKGTATAPRVEAPTVDRPYEPERVKEHLHKIIRRYEKQARVATEKQRKALPIWLSNMFPEEKSDVARHAVTHWLVGRESSKDLTSPEVLALIKWVDPDDENNPNQLAIAEAKKILRHIEKEQGQQELL